MPPPLRQNAWHRRGRLLGSVRLRWGNLVSTALENLGLSHLSRESDARTYGALAAVARRLIGTSKRAIGLTPAGPKVAVPAVGVQLALILAELSEGPVGYADPSASWPAFRRVQESAEPAGPPELSVTEVDPGLGGARITLTVPAPSALPLGRGLLATSLNWHRARGARVLVDLTGFDLLGEHLDAFSLLDGVLVVIRAHVTSEREVLTVARQIPKAQNLGALLYG